MKQRPKCPLCKKRGAIILAIVEGFPQAVFICGECYSNDKRVIKRVSGR